MNIKEWHRRICTGVIWGYLWLFGNIWGNWICIQHHTTSYKIIWHDTAFIYFHAISTNIIPWYTIMIHHDHSWSMMRAHAKHIAAQDPFTVSAKVRRRRHPRSWKRAPFDATIERRNLVRKHLGKIGLCYGLFQKVHSRRWSFNYHVLGCFRMF